MSSCLAPVPALIRPAPVLSTEAVILPPEQRNLSPAIDSPNPAPHSGSPSAVPVINTTASPPSLSASPAIANPFRRSEDNNSVRRSFESRLSADSATPSLQAPQPLPLKSALASSSTPAANDVSAVEAFTQMLLGNPVRRSSEISSKSPSVKFVDEVVEIPPSHDYGDDADNEDVEDEEQVEDGVSSSDDDEVPEVIDRHDSVQPTYSIPTITAPSPRLPAEMIPSPPPAAIPDPAAHVLETVPVTTAPDFEPFIPEPEPELKEPIQQPKIHTIKSQHYLFVPQQAEPEPEPELATAIEAPALPLVAEHHLRRPPPPPPPRKGATTFSPPAVSPQPRNSTELSVSPSQVSPPPPPSASLAKPSQSPVISVRSPAPIDDFDAAFQFEPIFAATPSPVNTGSLELKPAPAEVVQESKSHSSVPARHAPPPPPPSRRRAGHVPPPPPSSSQSQQPAHPHLPPPPPPPHGAGTGAAATGSDEPDLLADLAKLQKEVDALRLQHMDT